jgi:hypothetical protein
MDLAKGQLISEGLFDVLNFPKKKPTKKIDTLESKKWPNQQNKGIIFRYYKFHMIMGLLNTIKTL